MAHARPATDPLGVFCGHGEHEGSNDLAVDLAVVVADVAGHLNDSEAGGDGDGADQPVEESFPGKHQLGGELPDRLEVVVLRGDEQDTFVVFDRGGDGEAGGSFGVRAGHELVEQPIGDGDGHVGLSLSWSFEPVGARV